MIIPVMFNGIKLARFVIWRPVIGMFDIFIDYVN